MSSGNHHEIERKYLIEYPDTDLLRALPDCAEWDIEQIYLFSDDPDLTRRVRRVITNGETHYYKTFKRRVTMITAEEDEGEITQTEYEAYCLEADPACRPILKTRFRVPYEGHVLEFDVYPFWQDRAILEVELDSENEAHAIPGYVRIIQDVSDDPAYKNHALAAAAAR